MDSPSEDNQQTQRGAANATLLASELQPSPTASPVVPYQPAPRWALLQCRRGGGHQNLSPKVLEKKEMQVMKSQQRRSGGTPKSGGQEVQPDVQVGLKAKGRGIRATFSNLVASCSASCGSRPQRKRSPASRKWCQHDWILKAKDGHSVACENDEEEELHNFFLDGNKEASDIDTENEEVIMNFKTPISPPRVSDTITPCAPYTPMGPAPASDVLAKYLPPPFCASPPCPARRAEELRSDHSRTEIAIKKALAEGEQHLHSVKLCFVGHARAGKTSTLSALAGRPFDPEQPSTEGVATCSVTTDLLKTSQQNDRDASRPWSSLQDTGSVGDLYGQGVACAVAERLASPRTPSSSSGAKPAAKNDVALPTVNTVDAGAAPMQPSMMKMDIDLIARALCYPDDFARANGEEAVVMQTWDFAGQEMYYDMAHVFLTSRGIYALVLDLSIWAQGECATWDELDFWVAAIHVHHAPEARLVIIGTHDDALEQQPTDAKKADVYEAVATYLDSRLSRAGDLLDRLVYNQDQQLNFFPVDNRGKDGVGRLRGVLDKIALQMAGEVAIPTKWAHLFNVLIKKASDGHHDKQTWTGDAKLTKMHWALDDCRRLAEYFGMDREDLEAFLATFHSLGHLLYFPGTEAVVLDPQWLLDAMGQVVACPRHIWKLQSLSPEISKQELHEHLAKLHEDGTLHESLLDTLWSTDSWKHHRPLLRHFLEQLDLLIPSAPAVGSDPGKTWRVPSMLPKRPSEKREHHAKEQTTSQAVLFLDFKGTLRKLVGTLLPKLVCKLLQQDTSFSGDFPLYQDFVKLELPESSVTVMLEMLPMGAPEVVRVDVTRMEPLPRITCTEVKKVVTAICDALKAWLPTISPSKKVLCPLCKQDGVINGQIGHLLDWSEVISRERVLCERRDRTMGSDDFDDFLKDARAEARGLQASTLSRMVSVPSAGEQPSQPGHIEVHGLYASPLATVSGTQLQRMTQLNVADELNALQRVLGIHVSAQVATLEAVCSVVGRLADEDGKRGVLHIIAHGGCGGRSSCDEQLILETPEGAARKVTASDLTCKASWAGVDLLVLLSCNSRGLARQLIDRYGLRRAICCTDDVGDASARQYCLSLYKMLGLGWSIQDAHEHARGLLTKSDDAGKVRDAEKIVLEHRPDDLARATASRVGPGFTEPRRAWHIRPRRRPVEDYLPFQVFTMLGMAKVWAKNRGIILLWGPEGIGKSVLAQQLCEYYSLPGGRMFSGGAVYVDSLDESALRDLPLMDLGKLKDLFATSILKELAKGIRTHDQVGGDAAAGPTMARWAWEECVLQNDGPAWTRLLSALQHLEEDMGSMQTGMAVGSDAGRWLLCIDLPWHTLSSTGEALPSVCEVLCELLEKSQRLGLLLISRKQCELSPRLESKCKVMPVELQHLSPHDSAHLFMLGIKRPLFLKDFFPEPEDQAHAARVFGVAPLEDQLPKAPAHHLLVQTGMLSACNGIPGKIVQAARKVDWSLAALHDLQDLVRSDQIRKAS